MYDRLNSQRYYSPTTAQPKSYVPLIHLYEARKFLLPLPSFFHDIHLQLLSVLIPTII